MERSAFWGNHGRLDEQEISHFIWFVTVCTGTSSELIKVNLHPQTLFI